MSYLLDKKNKRKKIKQIAILVIVLLFLFYFRNGILNGLSSAVHFIFRPVFVVGKNIGNKFENIGVYFESKKLLNIENENLKLEKNLNEAKISNYNTVLDENNKLKEILGRISGNKKMIVASILSRPNRSFYDTFIIDAGEQEGVVLNQNVFAYGNVPIGKIVEVYGNSSKVLLFSSSKEKTEVIISGKDASMPIIGRGGGNFEMILPRDFVLEKGTEVILPGITPHTVAIVETILSDPRDSYQKALLKSPVNIFELKFVEVEK